MGSGHHSYQMSEKSQVSGSFFDDVLLMYLSLSMSLSLYLYLSLSFFWSGLLITLNKYLKGHKTLGSLLEGVL